MLNLYESLIALQHALNDLAERERRGENKRIDLPKTIDLKDLRSSPEIEGFLAEREKYRKATANVSVGIY